MELVERPRKPAPEEVLVSWAEQLAKEGKIVEVGRSFCHRGHFRSSHAALGGGTLICLDLPQQKDEQGLREVVCNQRGVRVYAGHESPHAEAIGSHLRLFHTVSEEEFRELRLCRSLRSSSLSLTVLLPCVQALRGERVGGEGEQKACDDE